MFCVLAFAFELVTASAESECLCRGVLDANFQGFAYSWCDTTKEGKQMKRNVRYSHLTRVARTVLSVFCAAAA